MPHNWPFAREIHRSPIDSRHRGSMAKCFYEVASPWIVTYHQKPTRHLSVPSCLELMATQHYFVIKVVPGGWFNIKMISYQYRKSHCGDKTILRPSYLHYGISYTGKMTSIYWIRALVIFGQHPHEKRKITSNVGTQHSHDVLLLWRPLPLSREAMDLNLSSESDGPPWNR